MENKILQPDDYLESRLQLLESYFVKYGAVPTDINMENRARFGQRATYQRDGIFFRADTMAGRSGTLLVIEYSDDIEFAKVGSMDDASAFPADFPDERIEKEVRYAFEIEPYPDDY